MNLAPPPFKENLRLYLEGEKLEEELDEKIFQIYSIPPNFKKMILETFI